MTRSEPQGEHSPLQRAYLRIVELEAKLKAARRENEPIAIIGMACRFPGHANGPRQYWQMLSEARDAITEIPRSRWNVDALYSPDPQAPGKMYTRWGGFIEDVDQFDPQFFAITPREAVKMDPQQRLLLEVTHEALEEAGLPADELKGSRTGVFTGTGFNDYARLLSKLDLSEVSAYSGSGIQMCFCTGRVSYVLGLRGPSIPVDTACSSSLVALHMASQSLRAGECDLALAGGVNLLLAPEANIFLSKAGALSPDGRCKTFDEAANGFVRGEGCGVVVLKRMSDALSNGDNILALIAGSAINHDGRSSGLTVPSGPAQEAVIQQALMNAGVEPDAVSYIEAHGTGTALGDPIEMQALAAVFASPQRLSRPLLVGSVKTNFGHLEAAAGIASLIKVVMMMQHRQIPAHLHFKKLSPHISIDQARIRIPTKLQAWEMQSDAPRVAGLSSFGLSGTNAHIVVREFADGVRQSPGSMHSTPVLLPLSAKRPEALEKLARGYREYLAEDGPSSSAVPLLDVCYTAAAGRSHYDHRLVLAAKSKAEAVEALDSFLREKRADGVISGHRPLEGPAKLVYVFSGQGAQRAKMGVELFESEPVFRAAIERCDKLYRDLSGVSLVGLLTQSDSSAMQQTEVAQPAVFALQVALAALWRSWGIEPDAVVGHSVGEIAAAHIAGALTLKDAVRLVHHRARLMQRLTGKGRMVAASLSPAQAGDFLAKFKGKLSIAAVNAPKSIVFSGETQQMEELTSSLKAQKVACRDLGVDYAFHSVQTKSLESEFLESIADLPNQPPSVPIFSTVTGRAESGPVFSANYWARNMTQPVLFAAAIGDLIKEDFGVFLELSAQPVLQGPIAQCLGQQGIQGVALPSLTHSDSEALSMKKSLTRLYGLGFSVNWKAQFPEGCRKVPSLPTYPWQHQRYWVDIPEESDIVGEHAQGVHDWLYELRWEKKPLGFVRPAPAAWLILADGQGTAAALKTALEADGHTATCLTRHDVFGGPELSLETLSGDSIRMALSKAVEQAGPLPWAGVVHLWSLDATPAAETTASSLMRDVTMAVGSAVQLIQSITSPTRGEPPRIWFVTKGAQAAGQPTESLEITQSPIWGIGRTCAAEFPMIWGGLVDLDPEAGASTAAEQIFHAICSGDSEDQVAFRKEESYVARVARMDSPEQRPFALRDHASYLITGGRSGVGFEVARWLARKGARHLILLARSPVPSPDQWDQISSEPDASLIARVRELQACGATVHLPAIDITNELQLRTFLDAHSGQGFPPIRGVFHAASVWKSKAGRSLVLPISQMDVDSLREVLPPKIVGSWLVRKLLGDSLDFLVLFSAGAAIVGSPGQGNYSAANAFMDALALDSRRKGEPRTLAINWGPIIETGFGTTPEGKALFSIWERRGIQGITPAQVVETIEFLIPQDINHAGVMRTDWELLRRSYTELLNAPWASALVSADYKQSASEPDLLAALAQISGNDRKPIIVEFLQQQVCRVMGFRSGEEPEPHRGLFDLGLDSLLALELKNRVQLGLKRDFPATAVFDYPSIDSLADYLLREVLLLEPVKASAPASNGNGSGILEQIDGLSEEQVQALLNQRMGKAEVHD